MNSSTLGPGDRIEVIVVGEEKLPKEYTIAPDGTINVPWIGQQSVVGLEPQMLSKRIHDQLVERQFLADPTVVVNVKEVNSKRVTVGGAVAKAGDVPFTPGLTLLRLVASAGGFSALANRDNVLVTRTDSAGQRQTVSFSVEDISEGRAPDVPLQAGDNVYVYERNF
jgi:polysaccharide export outer membrane protein